MDRASDFGSDGWEFESLRAHDGGSTFGAHQTVQMTSKTARRIATAIGAFITLAGVMHFANPKFFDDIVPPWLPPSERFWTYISGVAELIVGPMLLWPKYRKQGVWQRSFFSLRCTQRTSTWCGIGAMSHSRNRSSLTDDSRFSLCLFGWLGKSLLIYLRAKLGYDLIA